MPYTIGLHSVILGFLSATFLNQFTIAIIAFFFVIFLTFALQDDRVDSPIKLPGCPLLAAFLFFRQRFDFLNWGFQTTGQLIFQFQLLSNTVVVVSGEKARQTFFSTKGFDLTEGFKVLSGAMPILRGVTSDLQTRRITLIHKRLTAVQRNAPLGSLIPLILEDSRRLMETWGTSGMFDPFEKVYSLIFQTTVRSLSCSEISDDAAIVSRLKTLYDRLDTGTTPATVLIPWFPTPAMLKKLRATKEIYEIIAHAIKTREQSGVAQNDTLQMLLNSGDEKLVIVGFIMGLLIAGARATGTTASWLITFLGAYPEWRAKVTAEIEAMMSAYPPSTPPGSSSSLSAQLAAISLEVWESETPTLDAIICETLRIAQPHIAMRRNLGPEVYINDKVIPTGAYIVYPFSDVHLDPELYPDPWKFNPARKEQLKTSFGYIGWGGGKTVCLGSRLAKVELKVITAMFLLGFQYRVVDSSGKFAVSLPTPNWNDVLLCQPTQGPCYIKYERTGMPL